MIIRKLSLLALMSAAAIFQAAPSAHAIPHCSACPYSCVDLGLGKKDCSDQARGSGNVCCVDLSTKGLQYAQEHDRVRGENERSEAQDRCPAGFSPSENKCSPEERRRGCKDLRLPSGLGCVKR